MSTDKTARCRVRGRVARLVAATVVVAAGALVPTAVSHGDPLYPSNDCALGTPVIEGFVGDTHVLVRTAPGGDTAISVCMAVDDGVTHIGGKVVLDTGTPTTPGVDDEQAACADDPANERIRDSEIGPDQQPLVVDVTPRDSEIWVCVQATDQVAMRIVVPTTVGGTTFVADTLVPFPYVETPAPVGQPSSDCQNALAGRSRLANLNVAGEHVWLYAWQETASASHACVRIEGSQDAGGRLDLDTAGGQSFITTDTSADFTPCPVPVASDSGTPSYEIKISDPPEGSPAWACVELDGTSRRVTIDAEGGQGLVAFTADS